MRMRSGLLPSRWCSGLHTGVGSLLMLVMGLLFSGCSAIGWLAHGDSSVQVVVRTDPPGAKVVLDGKELGLSPVMFHDPSGSKTTFAMEITKDGYERVLRTLERKWDTMYLTYRLDPAYFYTLYPLPGNKVGDYRFNYSSGHGKLTGVNTNSH